MTEHTVFLPLVSGGEAPPLRIGTQNLGYDEMARAASVAGEIAHHYRLDVLALQEVYRWPHGADNHAPDLVAVLRQGLPGWHFHEGPAGEWMINLTASRYPMVRRSEHIIEERHLLHTVIAAPGGRMDVYNFHAKRDNDRGPNACRYNRAALAYIGAAAAGRPFVLVGDLNATVERLWGECNAGAQALLRRNPESYLSSDFHAGLWGPEVVEVEDLGNTFGLVDAHILTVATVRPAAGAAQREREIMDDYGNNTQMYVQPERIGSMNADDLIDIATRDALALEQIDALTERLAFVEQEHTELKARVAELERIVRGSPRG